jgi:hypothetical protein
MIALAGCMRLAAGLQPDLALNARANWELGDGGAAVAAATGV